MELSLNLICERLSSFYPHLTIIGNGSRRISMIAFFDPHYPDQVDQEALYVIPDMAYDPDFFPSIEKVFVSPQISIISPQNADHSTMIRPCLLMYAADVILDYTDGILVPSQYSIWEVSNKIMGIFRLFQDWEYQTKEALYQHKSISQVLTLCNLITPDTVWLSDTSLKRLGNSTPTLMEEISAIWNYQTYYGYVPMHIVKKLMENGEMEQLNTKRKAYICDTLGFNLPYTCKNIYQKGKLKAHLFFVSIYSKPNHTNLEMAEILGKILEPHLDQFSQIKESGSFHESYFRDILDGKLTEKQLISEQLAYFSWNLNDRYILTLIEATDVDTLKNDVLLYVLPSKKINKHCIFFSNEKHMFLLFHETGVKEIEILLEPVMERNNSHCAVSRPFSDLTQLPDVYERNQRSLKIGMDFSPANYIYNDDTYGLYYIAQQLLERYPITELCHDSIFRLYDYDKKNNTDYLNTLYQYLSNDRNVLKTAKAMYIHRNTLNYRLTNLNRLIGIDDISNEELHYILFSIYLIKYATETH